MHGDQTVIEHLNKALMNELTAINQYFLHARMLKNWGVNKLGKEVYKESIDEMWHADWLIERILFLDGMPDFKHLDKPILSNSVQGILEADLQQEKKAIPVLISAIQYCEKAGDFGSRQLLEKILTAEEEHMDNLEVHLHQIKILGMENYLLSQSSEE